MLRGWRHLRSDPLLADRSSHDLVLRDYNEKLKALKKKKQNDDTMRQKKGVSKSQCLGHPTQRTPLPGESWWLTLA